MMETIRLVLAFLVLGVAVGAAISERPPIFRFSYELASLRGCGKPGRAY